jgi:hypothetical protein
MTAWLGTTFRSSSITIRKHSSSNGSSSKPTPKAYSLFRCSFGKCWKTGASVNSLDLLTYALVLNSLVLLITHRLLLVSFDDKFTSNHLERECLFSPLKNRQHPGVNEISAHCNLFRVTHSTVNLQRFTRNPFGCSARV